jgi:hypothetical protein
MSESSVPTFMAGTSHGVTSAHGAQVVRVGAMTGKGERRATRRRGDATQRTGRAPPCGATRAALQQPAARLPAARRTRGGALGGDRRREAVRRRARRAQLVGHRHQPVTGREVARRHGCGAAGAGSRGYKYGAAGGARRVAARWGARAHERAALFAERAGAAGVKRAELASEETGRGRVIQGARRRDALTVCAAVGGEIGLRFGPPRAVCGAAHRARGWDAASGLTSPAHTRAAVEPTATLA